MPYGKNNLRLYEPSYPLTKGVRTGANTREGQGGRPPPRFSHFAIFSNFYINECKTNSPCPPPKKKINKKT